MGKRLLKCKKCGKEVSDYECRKQYFCSRSCQISYANSGRKKSKLWDNLDLYNKEYKSGLTFKEIADKYNICKTTLQIIFQKADIKTRRIGTKKGITAWNKGLTGIGVGEKNGNWKGGITKISAQIRTCKKYIDWRKTIFERDNYTCQLCNKRGGELNVDHYLIMFSEIVNKYQIKSLDEAKQCKDLWDLNNGRTLCKECHKKTFTFLGNQYIQRAKVTKTENRNRYCDV